MIFIPDEKKNALKVRKKSIPYQTLAVIYNRVMRHVNYSQWATYIATIIRKSQSIEIALLDIGCGTGEFIREMGILGYSCDGCDPSEAMLQVAQLNNPHKKFWVDKLPELEQTRGGIYNVITCLYDTINYLSGLALLEQALNRVYTLLPARGMFIFDVVSKKFCELYFDDVKEEEIVNKQYAYSRKSYFNKSQSEQVNEFIIYTPSGIFEERHIQKIFSFSDIENLIRDRTPFKILNIYEDFTFFKAEANSDRAHFILKKSE